MRGTTLGLYHCIGWFSLAAFSLLGAPVARGAEESLSEFKAKIEAEVNAIKERYETKIQGLESRVGTLESENARLRRQKSPSPASTQSPEVASLKQRISKLEQTTAE